MTQPFTAQDADALITHAQTVPLRNMRHAEEISLLLNRFREWVIAQERIKIRKAVKESPASPPEDPAS